MDFNETVKQMYNKGIKDENFVMELTKEVFDCKTYTSSKYEDIKLHVDFWCEANNKKYGIDVKGLHKNKRTDKIYDDTIQWIEMTNVQGKQGWIYGKAAYIAFITNNSVIYCSRKKLSEMVEEKIKNKVIVSKNPNECYIPYQRFQRLDKIVKVPTDDIRKIAKYEIIFKKEK